MRARVVWVPEPMTGQWWGLLAMMPVVVALWWWQRSRHADAPVDIPAHRAPDHIDLADLTGDPETAAGASAAHEWHVVLFSSLTCSGCAQVWQAAEVLESSVVNVRRFEFGEHRDVHQKYRITAVPTLVIANANGTVLQSFLGSVSATHLWASC